MTRAYYNEIDLFAAAWLRELIRDSLIADGDVDTRSIEDVSPADLVGYTQCHFFAGIAGWSRALRLAGWPDSREVWTGSCPCQPFSVAGAGKGTADERHLWPAFHRLISECRPSVVFGEQVASAAGRLWLTGVRADLERVGYACGAADLCASGIGAPHIRQRLYWVADAANGLRRPGERGAEEGTRSREIRRRGPSSGGFDGRVADATNLGRSGPTDFESERSQDKRCPDDDLRCEPVGRGAVVGLGDSNNAGLEGRRGVSERAGECAVGPYGSWRDSIAWPCRDGKRRRVPGEAQSVFQRVVAGLPGGMDDCRATGGFPLTTEAVKNRVGLLRGYGNAIVPPLACEFVKAYTDLADATLTTPEE